MTDDNGTVRRREAVRRLRPRARRVHRRRALRTGVDAARAVPQGTQPGHRRLPDHQRQHRPARVPPRLRQAERRHRRRTHRGHHPPRLLRRLAQGHGRHGRRQAGLPHPRPRPSNRRTSCEEQSSTPPATSASRSAPTRRSSKPTDAIIRLSATCVCGSDLWPYRGIEPVDGPTPMGHEYVGIVEEVGSERHDRQARPVRRRLVLRLRQHLRDLPRRLPVLAACTPSSCGAIGTQAEYARIPLADGTLVATPDMPDRRPDPQPAGRLRRARHRLVRRRRRRGRPRQDRRRRRRRRGRPARRPRRQAARRRADHRHEPPRAPPEARPRVRRHRHRHRARRRRRRQDQGAHRRARRALGHRGRRHPGVDDAGHPLHPPRRPRRLRRRLPRRRRCPATSCSSPTSTCTAVPPRCAASCPSSSTCIWNRQIDPGKVFDLTLPLDQVAEGYRAMDERRAIKTLLTL